MEKEGIRKLYVRPILNNTMRVGVENMVYNALLRSIAAHDNVRIVQNEADADARLEGIIVEVRSVISSSTEAGSLGPPGGFGTPAPVGAASPTEFYKNLQVATEYSAQMVCQFTLFKKADRKGPTRILWQNSFERSKGFPAFVQLGVPGTTSALITETEFYRTLGDIATGMMDDVHESIFAVF